MKKFFYFAVVCFTMILAGCESNTPNEKPSSSKSSIVETGAAQEITHQSARIYGSVNVEIADYDTIAYGVLYSMNKEDVISHSAEKVFSTTLLEENEFSVCLEELQSDTTYYYCAFVCLNNTQNKYGNIKEFSTLPDPNSSEDDNPVDNPENENGMPIVESPGAGKTTVVLYVPENTPAGCYAVGSFNYWDDHNTEFMFTPVGAKDERWVACTFDYAPDMELKVIAIPSDPYVTPDWSYQWGKNIDPENNLEEDNVVILDGTGELLLENQGQPKLMNLADASVIYINVKAWATTPVIEEVPCETAAFKHPWGGGDWLYLEATKTAYATFEVNDIYGAYGLNVATDINGNAEHWYPETDIEFVGDVALGDYVNFKFISERGTIGRMIITLIEKGNFGTDEPSEAKDITVKAKVPHMWTNTITAWIWPTGGEGQEVVPTKEGDWYVYTHHCAELNIIFKNGESWNGDANQTVDITGIQENTCLELESDGATKATYTMIDCW